MRKKTLQTIVKSNFTPLIMVKIRWVYWLDVTDIELLLQAIGHGTMTLVATFFFTVDFHQLRNCFSAWLSAWLSVAKERRIIDDGSHHIPYSNDKKRQENTGNQCVKLMQQVRKGHLCHLLGFITLLCYV